MTRPLAHGPWYDHVESVPDDPEWTAKLAAWVDARAAEHDAAERKDNGA